MDWIAMNEHHRAGVNAFVYRIRQDLLFWDHDMPYTLEDGVKVF